jgi:type II secretory pathway pseudopilin PulG
MPTLLEYQYRAQNAELKAANEALRSALQGVTNVADQYCVAKSVLENNIIFKHIGAAKKLLHETKQ